MRLSQSLQLNTIKPGTVGEGGSGPAQPEWPVGIWADFDAEQNVTLIGNEVDSVEDAAGSGRLWVALEGVSRPLLVNHATMGQAIRILSLEYMRIGNFPMNSTGYTIFIVYDLVSFLTNATRYLIGTSAGNNIWVRQNSGGVDNMRVKHAGSGRFINADVTVDPALFMWRTFGAGPRARYRGAENSQSNGTVNYGNVHLFPGVNNGGGSSIQPNIKRIVLWDRPLTNAEITEAFNILVNLYPWIVNP